jgi:hypothetical protein
MIGMGFGASPLFTSEIETEVFSATIAEFKEVRVQNSAADFTVPNLHPH